MAEECQVSGVVCQGFIVAKNGPSARGRMGVVSRVEASYGDEWKFGENQAIVYHTVGQRKDLCLQR
jgi:hypothetical protein